MQVIRLGFGSRLRRLPAGVGPPARAPRQGGRRRRAGHRAAARARRGLHRGQAHRAPRAAARRHAGHRRRPRREDHLARPGPDRGVPDRPAARADRRRRPRAPSRGHDDPGLRRLRGRRDPGRGTQRDVGARRRRRPRRPRGATRPEDRRHRDPGQPERHDARVRPQLRQRPGLGRRHHPVRDRRRRRDVADQGAGSRRDGARGAARTSRSTWSTSSADAAPHAAHDDVYHLVHADLLDHRHRRTARDGLEPHLRRPPLARPAARDGDVGDASRAGPRRRRSARATSWSSRRSRAPPGSSPSGRRTSGSPGGRRTFGVTTTGSHVVEPLPAGGSRATLAIEWTGPLAAVVRLAYGKLTQRYVDIEAGNLKDRAEAA